MYVSIFKSNVMVEWTKKVWLNFILENSQRLRVTAAMQLNQI